MDNSHSGHRLKVLLRSTGQPSKKFADDFGISTQTLNNWFVRGVPGKNLLSVSKYLRVKPEWLDSGEGEVFVSQIDEDYRQLSDEDRAKADKMYADWSKENEYVRLSAVEKAETDKAYAQRAQRPGTEKFSPNETIEIFDFPEISWRQAGAGIRALKLSGTSSRITHKSEIFAGPLGFWLRVTGSSMVSTSEVSFPEGYLILVAPEVDPRPGQFVVARLIASNEATFKQLVWDAGEFFMKPLNPAYPIKHMGDEWEIVGTVVDGKIPRSVFE
ncbi:LexA family transcriptional regulator [Pseudomonas tolaasii]|uniref:LexA family transcriptional regulator n=1 Tax=Pseudomonas tolaasii TaxID=29442 RepID=UPI00214CFCF6|nr:XRE family transcriptional regulator [Pseudomonas tolaasii]